MIFTNGFDEQAFDVEFMTCVVDKADDLVVTECDSHFCDFVGIHPSKIAQHKLYLIDALMPKEREEIMRLLCRKNSPYIYFKLFLKNEAGEYVFVHAMGQNIENTTLCRLTFADVSRSVERSREIESQANEIHNLIDIISAGVALFKVNSDMHFSPIYLNEKCCKMLGTTKEAYRFQEARIDEFIHPEDRSKVFQAIGNSMATHKPIILEFRIKAHENKFFKCKMNSAIYKIDSDGCPIFHAVFTNIASTENG